MSAKLIDSYPLVSVVTPSLNMAPFLEQAIQSVLSQDYPNLEYQVMDGGSTDGTLAILKRYEGRMRWESRPDRGQCDAINCGFLESRGEIFGYLCADDAYLPGAVRTAVQHLLANPGYAGVYGEGYLVNEQGTILCRYPTREFDPERLKTDCFICQPAVFLRREVFAEAGMLDPNLHYAVDYDLWARIAKRHRLLKLDEYLAVSRMHRRAKTLSQRRMVYKEQMEVALRHYGYAPFSSVYGYCCALLDRRDGFFEPVPPSLAKYALSWVVGSLRNWRHPFKFWKECLCAGLDAWKRGAWPLGGSSKRGLAQMSTSVPPAVASSDHQAVDDRQVHSLGAEPEAALRSLVAEPSEVAPRVWLDVGAHLGEKTFAVAQQDPLVRVYAFEPNLRLAAQRMGLLPNFGVLPVAVAEHDGSADFYLNQDDAASSLLPFKPEGLRRWIGSEQLEVVSRVKVPTIRLDTFLNSAGIARVDYLKVDAQGADLAVVRSAGARLRDIARISLEVQTTPVPLYEGSASKEEVVRYLEAAGFALVAVEPQSHGQEENLTFVRASWADEAAALEYARSLVFVRPLGPYPGWRFDADWENPEPSFRARREVWSFFNQREPRSPLLLEWYDGLRFELYLGNDLSKQLYVGGCFEPNEFAFLDDILQPGMVFLDAGANEGLYTLFAAQRVGPQGLVWAFEPSEREFLRLRRNVELNELRNVRLSRTALADRNGEEDLLIAEYEHAGHNTLGAFAYPGVTLQRTERVAVRRLDALLAEARLDRLDVLKLDVEGAEIRALEGAAQVLKKTRPVVLFEVLEAALRAQGGSREALLEWLRSRGYRLYAFDEDSGRPVPLEFGQGSDNMIAVPAERPLPPHLCAAPLGRSSPAASRASVPAREGCGASKLHGHREAHPAEQHVGLRHPETGAPCARPPQSAPRRSGMWYFRWLPRWGFDAPERVLGGHLCVTAIAS